MRLFDVHIRGRAALVLSLLLLACGRSALQEARPPSIPPTCTAPLGAITFDNVEEARGTIPTLLRHTAFQRWSNLGRFFDWKGRAKGPAIALPQESIFVASLGDDVGAAWFDAGRWQTGRVMGGALVPGDTFDGKTGAATLLEVAARLQVAVTSAQGASIHALGAGSLELERARMAAGFTDGDSSLWLWSERTGPTRLTRVSRDGARLGADVKLFDGPAVFDSSLPEHAALAAAASCGGGELAIATLEVLSRSPLRSRLSVGRVGLDGQVTEALVPVAADDRFSWLPALWCDETRTAVSWVENTEGAAGGLVATTRLMLDGRPVDDTPGVARYFPRLIRDGEALVLTWVEFGDDGYATKLAKRCD